ncbi:MAG: hypothetical protein RMA76_22515 [Deltaproteobacteria bacterium]|jgi:hypothetical protein
MSESSETNPISEAYQRATRINAKLASRYDANLASEGKQLAQQLFDHIKAQVEDYDDFVRRVERSEEFSLHDSAKMGKNESELKNFYVRAADLLETITESESRRR